MTTPTQTTMEQLYADAIAEGGELVVYAGGDSADMFDFAKNAFEAAFPKMRVAMQVNLSKYHAADIDRQLAEGALIPSVAHLQTLHDFDRWKEEGHLQQYVPLGAEHVPAEFKDADGMWHGLFIIAFSHFVNSKQVAEADYPADALDFLKPQFADRIALTYPNDDDAVLFALKRLVDKYGWSFLDRLVAQRPTFVRGLPAAQALVESGEKDLTLAGFGPLTPYPGTVSRFLLPATDPFSAWAQSAAIFKQARHPAAAKLYMSWWLSEEVQRYWPQWSVRSDLPSAIKEASLFDTNAGAQSFHNFMRDRAQVERFRFAVERVIGTAQGPSPVIERALPVADKA